MSQDPNRYRLEELREASELRKRALEAKRQKAAQLQAEGMNYEEIAARLGMSAAGVRSIFVRPKR